MSLKSTDTPPPPSPSPPPPPPPPPELTALWDMDSADYECDCPGPPPEFRLPPPPRPPFLEESSGAACSETPIVDLETCEAVPVSILHVVHTKKLHVTLVIRVFAIPVFTDPRFYFSVFTIINILSAATDKFVLCLNTTSRKRVECEGKATRFLKSRRLNDVSGHLRAPATFTLKKLPSFRR